MSNLSIKNRAYFLFLITFLVLFTNKALPQEGKIGYIESMRLKTDYKEFADVQAKFDQQLAGWQSQADSLKKTVDSLQSDFD
ncbi:MAG TPA: hypothetical protein VGB01_00635, partial [candidate division Zixibacteria bacterium]